MRKILLTTIILTICCNVIISSRPIDRIVISCIAPKPNDSVTVFSFDNKFNVKKAIKQSVSVDSVDFVKERIMGLEKNSDLDFSNLKVSYKIMLIRNNQIEATVFGGEKGLTIPPFVYYPDPALQDYAFSFSDFENKKVEHLSDLQNMKFRNARISYIPSDIFFSSDISPEKFEYTCDDLKKVEYLNAKSIETLLKSLNSYAPSNKNVLFDTRCQITLFAENGISFSIFLNEGRKYLLLDNFLYEVSDSLDRLDICE